MPRYHQQPKNYVWFDVFMGVLCVLIYGALFWFSIRYAVVPALGHGAAEWIQRGGYKNTLGELCCGERDCAELADGDVKITAAGYFIK